MTNKQEKARARHGARVSKTLTEAIACAAQSPSGEGRARCARPRVLRSGPRGARAIEEAVIKALQGDIPLVEQPFLALAEAAGLTEKNFLSAVKRLLASGKLRSLRAIVRHRQAGYKANAMVAWQVPAAAADKFGKTAAASPAVSHCYERLTRPGWPYNLYTMVHGRSKAEIKRVIAGLAAGTGVKTFKVLESRREFKKTSMVYF